MDRLSQVAWLIRTGRQGATFDEIVAAAKAGKITETEAVDALEDDFEVSARQMHKAETPQANVFDDEPLSQPLEDELVKQEVNNLLLRVLNALPNRQRQCVELYYYEGMTQQQIADRLGILRSNVETHIALGVEKLKGSLCEDWSFSPQDLRIYSEGQSYYEAIMRAWRHNARTAHPCLYPYELWSRYNAGTRQHANGQWTPIVQDRLREYINICFGENCGIVKPYKY